MYENVTYEDILQRMLDRIPDSMDKREGSIIYDALAPAAVELQLMYIELDVILKETFADTASREYLVRRVAERGITPKEATHALLKGEFTPITMNIPIGSRFSCDELNYVVKEKIADGQFEMECEELGEVGNAHFGQMIPIDYLQGLETAYLTELLIPGEDEESSESIRNRYFNSFETKAYGGNVDDYLNKTNSLPGVGSTKVTPVWNGGGTVKLTILNSEFSKASDSLVESVQTAIDPTGDAMGVGIAPIGHVVTVDTVSDVKCDITASIVFQEGYSFEKLKAAIEDKIKEYLLELRASWANENNLIVRISQIESRIMGITGVVDISNTTLNGYEENLELDQYEIPVFGGVTNG